MTIIDENGRIFGVINAVDAIVVILFLGIVASGSALLLSDENDDGKKATVTIRVSNVKPFITDAVTTGPVPEETIVEVKRKHVDPATLVVTTDNGTVLERNHPSKKTLVLRVVLLVQDIQDPRFKGSVVEIGRELNLDLGKVSVRGNVTSMQEN